MPGGSKDQSKSGDKHIPLSDAEKVLVVQYTNNISSLRASLNDILGVMISARGLSAKDYIIDLQGMEIRTRRESEKTVT